MPMRTTYRKDVGEIQQPDDFILQHVIDKEICHLVVFMFFRLFYPSLIPSPNSSSALRDRKIRGVAAERRSIKTGRLAQ